MCAVPNETNDLLALKIFLSSSTGVLCLAQLLVCVRKCLSESEDEHLTRNQQTIFCRSVILVKCVLPAFLCFATHLSHIHYRL